MRTRALDRPTLPGHHIGLFARGRRRNDHRLASLLASDSDTVLVLRGPVVTSASESARDLLGWEPSLCLGRTLSELMDGPEPGEARKAIDTLQDAAEAAGGHIATHRDLALTHVDGQTVWVDANIADLRHDADVGGTIVTFHDVTERHALEERLRDAEFRDQLTGLANRKMLQLLLGDAMRVPQHLALMLVDLDGLGAINDAYGTAVGDAVLVEVGVRLASTLRSGDHVARISGDEFILVINGLDPDDPAGDAAEVEERVDLALEVPVMVDGLALPIDITVGVAFHDGTVQSATTDGARVDPSDLLAMAAAHLRTSRRSMNHPAVRTRTIDGTAAQHA